MEQLFIVSIVSRFRRNDYQLLLMKAYERGRLLVLFWLCNISLFINLAISETLLSVNS